jgi:hypothetical protein
MARTSRTRMFRSLWCVLVVSCLAAAPAPRVRSTDPVLAPLLAQAQSGSRTFRDLVRAIETTDGIVYVERGRCGHGVHACLSLQLVAGEGFRLLRIIVEIVDSPLQMMATIGHELQHALEVLMQPGVRTSAAAYLYYAREAATVRDAFETVAAVHAGLQVERELQNAADVVRVADHAGTTPPSLSPSRLERQSSAPRNVRPASRAD